MYTLYNNLLLENLMIFKNENYNLYRVEKNIIKFIKTRISHVYIRTHNVIKYSARNNFGKNILIKIRGQKKNGIF